MRLIHTTTLKIYEFAPKDVPPYAILSHTWGSEEVTFQDMSTSYPPSKTLGYDKIMECAKQVRDARLDYVWIDTCCIDKTSSAELSEAINSMFRWYQEAVVCYIYLSDVHTNMEASQEESQLLESRWFTRGWTLQELIASDLRVFFNAKWVKIGFSSKERLELPKFRMMEYLCHHVSNVTQQLSQITGIPTNILRGDRLEETSTAQRMSWAAYRQTTRIEDEAYCLLGIFKVNMPLLYGEGRKAFIRLQEEILKYSDDQSILAHISPALDAPVGLLAQSPAFFALTGDIRKFQRNQRTSDDTVALTKQGLKVYSTVCPLPRGSDCLVVLDCTVGRSTVARPAIYLERQRGSDDCYQRHSHRSLLILYPKNSGSRCDMIWRPEMLDESINTSLSKP
jgi:Heterokaryon incompatibility protein (HET)